MRSEIGVDNDIFGDARVKMDYDDKLYDYYIFSNEVKDEWIDSLQVDFSISSTLNDAFSSDND